MQVLVRPAAAADIDDAFLWYEQQRAGLGDDFLRTWTARSLPFRATLSFTPFTVNVREL
jgi:hypothetical protein